MKQFRFTLLLFVTLLFGLTACRTAPSAQAVVPPSAAPTMPTTRAISVPPTTVPPTLGATAVPAQAQTTLASKILQLPMTARFGAEWSIQDEYADVVTLVGPAELAFIIVKDVKIADPTASFSKVPFPDDFVGWIKAHGLFPVVDTQPVTVGGFKGIEINTQVTSDCGAKRDWLFLSETGWNCRKGEYYHFILLNDVYGQRVLIMNTGGDDFSAEHFKAQVAASQQVLDTVVLSKPGAAVPTSAPATANTTSSPKAFKLPMKSSFGPDWTVVYDVPGKFAIDNKNDFGLAYYIVTAAKLADPMDGHLIPFPEDLLAWLKSNPDFNAIKSSPVTVAGIEGLQIDATPIWKSTTSHLKPFLSLSGDTTRNLEGQPDGENIVVDPEQWRFILLNDVNGERVLIMLIDSNGHKFEDAVQESQKVLDSVVFSKPVTTAQPASEVPTAKVLAEWKVNNPSGIFIGFDSVWVPGHHDSTTTRIDPATNKVSAVIQGTGNHAEQALAVGDVLWITGQRDDTTWLDPKSNTVTKTAPKIKGEHHYIAHGFNSLWITTGDNKLDRVDPATSKIIASIPYADGYADCQGFVVATTTAVWVEQCDKAELTKVDPATNSVVSKTPWTTLIDQAKAQITIPAGKGTDFIWISTGGDGIPEGLLRVDPNTGAGLTFLPLIPDQSGDGFLAVSDAAVWIGGNGQINRVNVATNRIDATYKTDPGAIIHLGLGFGSVWLENYEENLVQRLDIAP